jgi:hypothetical protein
MTFHYKVLLLQLRFARNALFTSFRHFSDDIRAVTLALAVVHLSLVWIQKRSVRTVVCDYVIRLKYKTSSAEPISSRLCVGQLCIIEGLCVRVCVRVFGSRNASEIKRGSSNLHGCFGIIIRFTMSYAVKVGPRVFHPVEQ